MGEWTRHEKGRRRVTKEWSVISSKARVIHEPVSRASCSCIALRVPHCLSLHFSFPLLFPTLHCSYFNDNSVESNTHLQISFYSWHIVLRFAVPPNLRFFRSKMKWFLLQQHFRKKAELPPVLFSTCWTEQSMHVSKYFRRNSLIMLCK